MAKLEIPSIIVNNTGSNTSMDKTNSLKNKLSKQDEFEEIEFEDLSPVEILPECNEKKDKKSTKDQKLEKNKVDVTLTRQRPHPKVKLLQRSHALRDDTSPPPDMDSSAVVTLSVTSPTVVTQNKNSSNKPKLGKQGSSQGSMEGSSPCLSRESSTEQYTDSTGIDLHQFIVDTLHRNQKDRILLLKIEQELGNFLKDNKRQNHKFPQMSSYQRMLVHRVAAYFGMEHNVDQAGTSVVINKTKATRLPDKKFRDLIRDELVPEEPKKSILKRDSSSFEEGKDLKSPERQLSSESRRSKSFEEREEEYEKARARIFNQDSSSSQEGPVDSPVRSHESTHNSSRRSSQEDLRWITDPRPWSSTDSDSSNRPLKPMITKTSASIESDISATSRPTRGVLTKAESAENRETLRPRSRPSYVPKASSFGGISVLVRGDSMTSTRSATPRLTKAGNASFAGEDDFIADASERPVVSESFSSSSASGTSNHHLSPSRANEKSYTTPAISSPSSTSPALSSSPQLATVIPTTSSATSSTETYQFTNAQTQVQPSTTVTSTATSSHPVWPSSIVTSEPNPQNFVHGQQVMWAVSNVESVPPGSLIINPHTLQPYTNPDGSVYRHNNLSPFPTVQPVANSSATQQPINGQTMIQQQSQQPLVQHMSVASTPIPQVQASASLQHQVQVQAPLQSQAQLPPPTPLLPPVVLYNQLINQPQAHQIEQRPFTLENNSIGDISGSLNSLSFTHPIPTDAGASGDGNQIVPSASLQFNQQGFMSSVRPAGLVASTQGNAAQPVRVVYPVPYLSSLPQNQQSNHQLTNPLASGQQSSSQTQLQQQQQAQHQSSGQITLHNPADNLPHPPSQTQLPGQYVQTFPVVGYSQVPNQPSGDSFSFSMYYHMASQHALGSSSGVTSVPNFSYTAPSTLGTSSTTNSNMNASQPLYLPNNFMYPPLPIPSSPAPNIATPGSFAHPQNSYRSQTPPTHNSSSQGLSLNQAASLQQGISLNSPYMGYSVYPPHSTPVQQATPTTPTQSAPGQNALFPSPYSQPIMNAAFPMFRPGIPLMTVRSSTPPPPPPVPVPPHGLLQSQYNTGPLLTKSYSLPADHRFGKAATEVFLSDSSSLTGNHNQDKNIVTAGISPLTASASVKPPHLYGRGLMLHNVGDLHLVGHPLQHQLTAPIRTSIVLPQQRPLNRFPAPQGAGCTNVNRPPKVRKQRSRACSSNKVDSANVTPQASVDLPDSSWGHILEIQSLPEGLKRSEAERYLEEVTTYGGKLVFCYEGNVKVADDSLGDFVLSPKYQVLAAFQSETEAQSALVNIKTSKFQLRLLSKKPPLELLRLN